MSDPGEKLELEDLAVQPGTYFNPQTEVILVVDDSVSIDQEIFNMEEFEGADWVRISEEVPVDEHGRDDHEHGAARRDEAREQAADELHARSLESWA